MQAESPGLSKQQISAFGPPQRCSIKNPPQELPLLVLTHVPPAEVHESLFEMRFPAAFKVTSGVAIAMLRSGIRA